MIIKVINFVRSCGCFFLIAYFIILLLYSLFFNIVLFLHSFVSAGNALQVMGPRHLSAVRSISVLGLKISKQCFCLVLVYDCFSNKFTKSVGAFS